MSYYDNWLVNECVKNYECKPKEDRWGKVNCQDCDCDGCEYWEEYNGN